jgi:hypothetical protein
MLDAHQPNHPLHDGLRLPGGPILPRGIQKMKGVRAKY